MIQYGAVVDNSRMYICGVQDRLDRGHAMTVFSRKWPVGETVEIGSVMHYENHQLVPTVERGRFRILGHVTHQKVRALANKTRYAHLRLKGGFWHEVISD